MTDSINSSQGKSLPASPNLQHLKDEAKSLLKKHKRGDSACCTTLKQLHKFKDVHGANILKDKVSLQEVQFALALEYGFEDWVALKKTVLGKDDDCGFLHLLCGDTCAQALRDSTVPGEVLVAHECYLEGPVPGNVTEDEFCRIRAEEIARWFTPQHREQILANAHKKYERIDKASDYREVILWFDACMFDQTHMIPNIDRLSRMDLTNTRLSLICVGEFPGFDAFKGLGELNPKQMASLLETRHELTNGEIELAQDAWRAFRSDDARELQNIAFGDCSALPYLAPALKRFLQEYPSVKNGLGRSQEQIITAVGSGKDKLTDIFVATQNMEEQPFAGDTMVYEVLYGLIACTEPLLKLIGPDNADWRGKMNLDEEYRPLTAKEMHQWTVSLTDAGRDVLNEKADQVRLNGVDCWRGGVHLQSDMAKGEVRWRWNEKSQKLVEYSTINSAKVSQNDTSAFVNDKNDSRAYDETGGTHE